MDANVNIPSCCGKTMRIHVETQRLYEVHCDACGDTVYIKKDKKSRPVLLDD